VVKVPRYLIFYGTGRKRQNMAEFGRQCDGARVRHLLNSAKFCYATIGSLTTSALATPLYL